MTDLSGYEFETLCTDGDFVLSRGTRWDAAPVLVLAPAAEEVTPTGLARLQRAHALRDELHSEWAARPRLLVTHQGRPTLVSEDPGGDLLARWIGRPWPVDEFLRAAIGLASALRQLHARALVHKDIKPTSVLTDGKGGVWLTGFGITSRLPRERQLPEPPEVIAGTLAYMAPEQTGRMNRSIDSRTDLYALGVTLYELLSGTLPFSASDPMEWVHCHVARQPASLHKKADAVSGPICDIVMKLLAKTAEDRYQTAAGVERDLRRALERWTATGRVDPFVLAAQDASDRLLIPERLYGRDAEIGVLLSSFERVVATGESQLVLVSGYSGIGKSSVVNELHRVLVPPRGLFAAGKFDQYKRDIPYATLAQAFTTLIRHVLGRRENEITVWREKLAEALGPNGRLISNLVPELEIVIGKQPPVPEIPPKDAQARFQAVVRRFLAVFAQPEHPLALFLDDLQWLDAATLELLQHLVGEAGVRHLLVVGAYRDNEVGPTHPLSSTLDQLRRDRRRVHEIELAPLAIGDLSTFCGDALRVARSDVRPLAELVHEKTAGNPFFVIQFITALVDEALLTFNSDAASWRWDVDAIRAKGFTDNVVDLMAGKLHRLPEDARRALRQLAFLGSSARAYALTKVFGVPEDGIHAALEAAVTAGLALRSQTGYGFVHDRVQEAAYALIPESERAAEHLRIGRILIAGASPRQIDENIFEYVNHLNRGATLIASQKERDRVADLNFIAGRRAKASTANAAARTFTAFGRSLLGADTWERSFRLTFDLELQLADCEFLTSEMQPAESRLDRLRARAVTLPDRAAVIFVQTNLYTAMPGRSDRAIEICLEYLAHVGVDWEPHPSQDVVDGEHRALMARIAGRSIEELVMLPLLEDPDVSATLDVLLGMLTPAFQTDPALVALILCRMANVSIQHGNSAASSLGYAFLGMTLSCTFGDYDNGYLFGKLAADLVEQRGLTKYRGRVYHALGTHVLPWTRPIAEALANLRRGKQIMQEIGDVTYIGFGCIGIVTMMLAGGDPLEQVQAEVENGIAAVEHVKFQLALDFFAGQLRLTRALRGLLGDPCSLDDGGRPFAADISRCWYSVRLLQTCVLFGDFRAGVQAASSAERLIHTSMVFYEHVEFHFYAALARAAQLDHPPSDERAELRSALAAHRRFLAVLFEHCPQNYAGRLALVDAEIARTEGRPLEAMDAYERAVAAARAGGFLHDEALTFETAARFYRGRGFQTIAEAYVQHARSAYLRWGATGKVRQLDRLRERTAPDHREPAPPAVIETPATELDLASVVKSSQAVTGEVGLPKLIETLMVIALEHAGAERGLLILPRQGELRIEAQADGRGERGVSVGLRCGVARYPDVPETLVHYVSRTHEIVLIPDAQAANPFSGDPYLCDRQVRSVVCVPLVKQTELIGMLYLENNLAPDVFTNARIAVLRLLASQAATSLQNASLEEENASLAEKESLLKEVHHRVKNNLQLISSLLSLQASRASDPSVAELFADSRNRVRSMALVHENLYRAGNFARIPMAAHVRTLCAHVGRAYDIAGQNVGITVNVGDLNLEMSHAVNCGLIINELVTNALKHAFRDGRAGRVWVELRSEEAVNTLVVRDDGVGLPSDFSLATTTSLGLGLVRDLAEQLQGAVAIARGAGATFTVTFPGQPLALA